MNYRIKIFSSFCNSTHAKKSIEELLTQGENMYRHSQDDASPGSVYIVDEDDLDYSHVIIWNTAMPSIPRHIPKEHVIGFAYEPLVYLRPSDAFLAYAAKHIHTYYIGDADGLSSPFVEGNAYLTYSPPRPDKLPLKSACMSMVLSHKTDLSGHMYRHAMVDYILYHKLPIDIYGTGTQKHLYKKTQSDRIKGAFRRYEPYEEYMFSICIENTQSNHYFSEKVINPLLRNTTPVYLGCKHIDTYFPDNVIHLTGDISHDMNLLVDILRNPQNHRKKIDVVAVEKRVSLVQHIQGLYETNKQMRLIE